MVSTAYMGMSLSAANQPPSIAENAGRFQSVPQRRTNEFRLKREVLRWLQLAHYKFSRSKGGFP
jgi:hypothetical protein